MAYVYDNNNLLMQQTVQLSWEKQNNGNYKRENKKNKNINVYCLQFLLQNYFVANNSRNVQRVWQLSFVAVVLLLFLQHDIKIQENPLVSAQMEM